jgi:hypothetical protein
MFENRISQYFPVSDQAMAAPAPAFIACPLLLVAGFSPMQQSFVAEVYRRAQEMTEQQLRKPARRLIPEFSLN